MKEKTVGNYKHSPDLRRKKKEINIAFDHFELNKEMLNLFTNNRDNLS